MKINKDNDVEDVIEKLAETVVQETTGVDIEKVAQGVEELVKDVEGQKQEASSNTTNTDSLYSTIEKQKAEIEKLKTINLDSIIIERTKLRTALINKASSLINVDSLIDKSERQIMEASICAKVGKNLDLSNRSDDYVQGRFDSVIEDLEFIPFKRQMSNLDSRNAENKPSSLFEALQKQQSGK